MLAQFGMPHTHEKAGAGAGFFMPIVNESWILQQVFDERGEFRRTAFQCR